MTRRHAFIKLPLAAAAIVLLIAVPFSQGSHADDKKTKARPQQSSELLAPAAAQPIPPREIELQEKEQMQRDIVELKTSVARLQSDNAHLTEADNRTWDVVVGLAVGLLLLVVGAGTAMWAWPRRVFVKIRQDIGSEASKAVAQLTESGGIVSRQLEQYVGTLTSKLQQLVSVEVVFTTGRYLQDQGKIDEAISCYSEALRLNPMNAACLYNRALCYRKRGRRFSHNAVADLLEALNHESYKNNADAVFSLAEALYVHGDHAEAIVQAKKALDLGITKKANAYTLIGDCFRRAARGVDHESLGKAIASYDQCLANWHSHTSAIEGKAYALMSLRRYDEAVEVCTEPIDEGQTASIYNRIRAQALWCRNRDDDRVKAWKDLGESKERTPRDTKIYVLEADFLESQANSEDGDQREELLKKAAAALRQGCEFSPPGYKPVFRNRLTGVLLLLGETTGAMKEAEMSVKESGQYVQNWMALAVALLAGRRWMEARKAAQEGLSVASHAPGQMWCKFFNVVAAACQGENPETVSQLLKEIEEDLQKAPYFKPIGGWYNRVILDTIATCSGSMERRTAAALTEWAERLFMSEGQSESEDDESV